MEWRYTWKFEKNRNYIRIENVYSDCFWFTLPQWFPNCTPRNIPPVPLITIYLFNYVIVQIMYLFNTFYINCLWIWNVFHLFF
jgi:hypothetical protein